MGGERLGAGLLTATVTISRDQPKSPGDDDVPAVRFRWESRLEAVGIGIGSAGRRDSSEDRAIPGWEFCLVVGHSWVCPAFWQASCARGD
jgi:hypothetical protein